jgi:hypothetical protein
VISRELTSLFALSGSPARQPWRAILTLIAITGGLHVGGS